MSEAQRDGQRDLPFWDPRRPAGFRLWASDAMILTAGLAASWAAWCWLGEPALLLPLVLGHFFLFCNVFRVERWVELTWTILLLVNAAAWGLSGRMTIPRLFLTQLPLTLAALLSAPLMSGYRGVGYSLVRRLRE
ncbi:MAG: hypothetical protein ACYTGB_05370 [Planctomycetota bacterium]|jgi:hypothetical protein